MGRFNTVAGHAMAAGDPIAIVGEPKERGEVTEDQARRLWSGGTFVYAHEARPTPVESPEEAARRLTTMEDLGGGWYLINSPRLPEGEKVQGEDAATARRDALIAEGIPDGQTGTADARPVEEKSGTLTGPSVEERVEALVSGNTDKQLRAIIADLDKARAAATPPLPTLGAKSDHDKTDLARLIVGVDGDLDTPPGGTQSEE
ncbi:MAG: hypothetical protein ACJ8DZ_14065 [Allosphingosinicella sp.]